MEFNPQITQPKSHPDPWQRAMDGYNDEHAQTILIGVKRLGDALLRYDFEFVDNCRGNWIVGGMNLKRGTCADGVFYKNDIRERCDIIYMYKSMDLYNRLGVEKYCSYTN